MNVLDQQRRRIRPRPSLPVRLAVNVPIALALVGVMLYRFGAIQTLRVSTINMVPTLELEDRVMVRAYGREPLLGDVVVYRSPFDPEHLKLGRIVGVAGSRVELNEGGLHLDGKAAAVDAAGELAAASLVGAESVGDRRFFTRRAAGLPSLHFAPLTVPDDHFFILSDNRVDERDSRIFGAIPHHAIVGVLSFVYYAADETGIRWDRMTRPVS
jgi:signal peptidase I